MNTHPCCPAAASDHNHAPRAASRWRRGVGVARWIIPGATLILLPKCPVCFATYVALCTGVGISVTFASTFRTALLMLCVTVLFGLTLKALRRLAARKRRS